jgi:hypothetical protein
MQCAGREDGARALSAAWAHAGCAVSPEAAGVLVRAGRRAELNRATRLFFSLYNQIV